jgi:subtilisin-like proprotein convertase family protein/subtilisin family serine protease
MSNADIKGTYGYTFNTAAGTVRITADQIANLSSFTTGTLRLELWVTDFPWDANSPKDGDKIANVALSPATNGTLGANQSLYNVDQTVAFTKPLTGTHYVTMVLAEYTGKDMSIDSGYQVVDTGSFEKWMTVSSAGVISTQTIILPTVSIDSQTVVEGDDGVTKSMVFTLKLSQATPMTTGVYFDTYDQTAIEGVDYGGVHKPVVFLPGVTTTTVTVPIYGNNDFEPTRVFGVDLNMLLNGNAKDSDLTAVGYIADNDGGGLDLPTDGYMDLDWFLYTTRTEFAWQKATGKGVKVAVLDNGIDANHADLSANVRTDLGRTTLTMTPGGAPVTNDDNHGTLVAGVIAAARDGKGMVGVAYDAQLVSLYSASRINDKLPTEIANAYTYAKNFDVLNDSWGYGNLLSKDTNWAFLDNANDPLFAPAFKALHDLAADGRHGLGTVVVQSAGNGYSYGDDTNLHNFQNSRYVITVGATDYYGSASYFSTTGASILISAPGGAGNTDYSSIITTDRTGAAGESSSNYAFADGTSFSAPIVSGIVAMMLEVNPNLGYRDVQEILAYTAHQTDYTSGDVTDNGATNWNGGGLQFIYGAQTTGFGQVDALAAVRLAASWDSTPKTVANTVEVTSTQKVNLAIPDNNKAGIANTINVTSDMVVERADVSVNITHPFIGDLQIALTSPSGTTSYLMYRPSQGALSAYGSSQNDVHFTFDTVLNWGEAATGKWTLTVTDLATASVGSFTDWTLDLVGHAASKDDTYVYTNDFAALVKADPTRAILTDTDGGINTINTAALGADNYIDLSGATGTVLNDGKLTIAAGTVIRNAYAGDGNDTVIANALGGTLHGMDGNDILRGAAGSDILDGGVGNDTISGDAGMDTALFHHARADYSVVKTANGYTVTDTKGNDGVDQLSGIERLQFSDNALALDTTTGTAGQAYRMYQAAFNRTPDAGGLGYWIGAMDNGAKLIDVAKQFVSSNEFKTLYGAAPSNTELLTNLYANVLHRTPDAAGAAYWLNLLDSHAIDAAEALRNFSESAENVAALVGVTQNGIIYTPFHG